MRGFVPGLFFLAIATFAIAGCQPSKPCHCTQQQGCLAVSLLLTFLCLTACSLHVQTSGSERTLSMMAR